MTENQGTVLVINWQSLALESLVKDNARYSESRIASESNDSQDVFCKVSLVIGKDKRMTIVRESVLSESDESAIVSYTTTESTLESLESDDYVLFRMSRYAVVALSYNRHALFAYTGIKQTESVDTVYGVRTTESGGLSWVKMTIIKDKGTTRYVPNATTCDSVEIQRILNHCESARKGNKPTRDKTPVVNDSITLYGLMLVNADKESAFKRFKDLRKAYVAYIAKQTQAQMTSTTSTSTSTSTSTDSQ